jgi:hypothetical protein
MKNEIINIIVLYLKFSFYSTTVILVFWVWVSTQGQILFSSSWLRTKNLGLTVY